MNDFQAQIISNAIDHLVARGTQSDSLSVMAERAGYDPVHFQKIFNRFVGISPKKMQQFMAYRHARDFLLDNYTTLDAAYEAGLSGQGRLHDLFVRVEAATPGQVKAKGQGLQIRYGFHETPIGEILVAQTDLGVCWLGFRVNESRDLPMQRMIAHWPRADFIEDRNGTETSAAQIIQIWCGDADRQKPLSLHLHGTNFQLQVWRALLKIPSSATLSYQHVGQAIGRPQSPRAIGNAVGANPVSLLIPCHRVIQKSGIVENYGWGSARKKLLLGLETQNIPHGIKTGLLV